MSNALAIFALIIGTFIGFAFNKVPRKEHEEYGLIMSQGDIAFSPAGAIVTVPAMRAYIAQSTDQVAFCYAYRGRTEEIRPFASGEVRIQIGIKLRAANTCNTLYVMRWIAPVSGLMVAIKRNEGQETHAECGANGYLRLFGEDPIPLPEVLLGNENCFSAELVGNMLTVIENGREIWRGKVPAHLLSEAQRAGLRTDNGVFSIVPRWSY